MGGADDWNSAFHEMCNEINSSNEERNQTHSQKNLDVSLRNVLC